MQSTTRVALGAADVFSSAGDCSTGLIAGRRSPACPMRLRLIHVSRLVLAGALASLSLGLVLPSGANGASFSRARKQLRAWHLKPAPLFPSRAPAHHRHANVHLYRFAGVDYSADFGTPDNADCHTISPNAWCVSLRRSAWSDLARVLDNPRTYTNQRWVRAGKRHVLFYLAQNNAGGWWMSWRERGRTYNVWSWSGRRIALKRLTPFVKGLRPLR